ncbi:MAG TPA: tRNA (N6-isopentenyl adenosine(37)-C2)-methylthiotransferase MiaB [Dehalococcoidia bacterium]|nr:tRNA (N6-isopentenyl adenosine(37)-C2)-methylthiotransferase MiaB [Dehalococcoidia bacterium]
MPRYYIWTIGCQMNKAESQQIADYLEMFGYQSTQTLQYADLIVLNTCVVRQAAEDKVLGTLGYLKGIKRNSPSLAIVVTGCFVDSNIERLKSNFPYVDLFFKPGDYSQLLSWAEKHGVLLPDAKPAPPLATRTSVTAFIPIIQGCNNFCSYCIVPYRRGREKSRPITEIVCEVDRLVARGTKEVTLLGQNVNSYGHDLSQRTDLSELLAQLSGIGELVRIRFLTSHPKDVDLKFIKTIASLDKVCKHFSLPLQSGDNDILKLMGRGYTIEQYLQLIHTIRSYIPGVSLSTDVIVGFPGERDEQFDHTLSILEEVKFDTVHVAAFSPRPGTIAAREYQDNIPPRVKKERLNKVEALQARIAGEISSRFIGKTVEVLVEGKKGGKWYGRTRGDKLTFFHSETNCFGKLVSVAITKVSPWALQGEMTGVK